MHLVNRVFCLVTIFASIALSSRLCEAAACCGNGHGLGQRLGLFEKAAGTVSINLRERFGAYYAGGEYLTSAKGNFDRGARLDIGWLVEVNRKVQVGMVAPFLLSFRRGGELSSSGGGPGDVILTGRYDVIPLGQQGWIPPLALTAAITFPSGRSGQSSQDPLLADATGEGLFEFRPGVTVERTWSSFWFASAIASVGFRAPTVQSDGSSVEHAPRFQLTAVTGPTWPWGLSIAMGVFHEWEAAPAVDGQTIPEASRKRTAGIARASYDFAAHWTGTASLRLDLPVTGLGRNNDTALEVGFGMRYVWGNND